MSAASATERRRLLSMHRELADVRLAQAIKEICYSAWAAEPTKAQRAAKALSSLSKFSPDPEIGALALWISGISDITKGRLEAATQKLEAASAAFKKIGRIQESAQPKVGMLIPLAMLGRYNEAIKTGTSALRIFERYDDYLAAGKVEMNLSNILARKGLYRRSEKLGRSALERFTKIAETSWRTMAENDLANTYTELNDFRKAEEYYSRALESARASGMHVTEAEIEASIGNLSLFRGKYAEALSFLELSRSKYEELGMPHQSAVAELEIAGIYSELNLLSEAVEIFRRSAATLRRLKMRAEEARARADLGRALIGLGGKNAARRELRKAAGLYVSENNRTASVSVLLMLAKLEMADRHFEAAAETIRSASMTAARGGDERQKLFVQWLRCELSFAAGKIGSAARALEKIIPAARRLEHSPIEQAAFDLAGRIAKSKGDLPEAETSFRRAIETIEALRSPLPAEEFRIAFFSSKLEPYENLARLLIEQERYAEAFECFEQARSRSLIDAMEERGHAAAISGPVAEKVADLRDELNWFYSKSDRAEPEEAEVLRIEIRKREKSLSDLLRRIRSTNPNRSLTSTNSRHRADLVRNIQAELGPARALVEYVQLDGRISAFVVTDRDIAFIADIAKHDEIKPLISGLRFQFDSLRYQPDVISRYGAILKAKADKYLIRLYEKLLRPVEARIGDRAIVVAPVSLLHYVPFHALSKGGSYIIEEREVTYTPSGTVWARLEPAMLDSRSKALLIGFADESIPLVTGEVNELENLFRQSTVLSGSAATFGAYSRHAPEFDILHFACHGQFRPDNPSFSSLHLADGWVTMGDICSQSLRASLVTLSSCETGLSEIAEGEEVIGLSRGFLTAGAASIVLSLWTVNDSATADLMKDLYRRLQRGETVPASLRAAQRNLIEKGQHPFYWSPFMAIGK